MLALRYMYAGTGEYGLLCDDLQKAIQDCTLLYSYESGNDAFSH